MCNNIVYWINCKKHNSDDEGIVMIMIFILVLVLSKVLEECEWDEHV